MQNKSVVTGSRPTWVKVVLAILSAWWGFLISLILSGFVVTGVTGMFLEDGITGFMPTILTMSILACISVLTAVIVSRWQNKVMATKSMKANYIVLTILALLSFLFTPFTYTIF